MSFFFFFNVRGVSVKVYRVKICTKRYWYWFQFCIGCIIGSRLLWVWCPQICCLAIWKHKIILESAPYVNASIIQSLRSAICQKKQQLKTKTKKPLGLSLTWIHQRCLYGDSITALLQLNSLQRDFENLIFMQMAPWSHICSLLSRVAQKAQ